MHQLLPAFHSLKYQVRIRLPRPHHKKSEVALGQLTPYCSPPKPAFKKNLNVTLGAIVSPFRPQPDFLLHYLYADQPRPHGHLSRGRQRRLLAFRPRTATVAPPAQGRGLPVNHCNSLALLRSPRRAHLVRHHLCAADIRPRRLASLSRCQRLDW